MARLDAPEGSTYRRVDDRSGLAGSHKKIPLPWFTEGGQSNNMWHTVKDIIIAANFEASESNLTEEEIRAMTKVAAGAKKRHAGRANSGHLSE
ncbi:hypothetical protein ACUSIJ_20410 [Pseudochelatococcus sp. B33]